MGKRFLPGRRFVKSFGEFRTPVRVCVCVCVYVLKATDEAQHQSFSRSLADAPIFANQADTQAATCSRRLS